jgi:hypothetical protein
MTTKYAAMSLLSETDANMRLGTIDCKGGHGTSILSTSS